ncbi:MAG: relaxase domain-containing protein [Planctomycetales bacterium]|nr:relaxase domain-containing protein [Planctomycetales bacterium]
MLRITRQYSTAAVKKYYEHSDYYQEGPNALKGYWFGVGAKRLGLVGEVHKQQFDRVVENRHPFAEGESLTPRTRSDRVVGADFTFNAPKSISILWALTQNHRILDVVREAVDETLKEIEQDIETRVHVGKNMHREKTRNVIGASWLHTTARPENGIPMPSLHVHAWIANATHDGKKFKAIDFANVKSDAGFYEARFHSRLAERLAEQFGFSIKRQGKKWFDIEGVAREIVERYSERTQTIERVAHEKGIVDPEKKGSLGARTRQKKTKEIPPADLPHLWRWMLSDKEHTDLTDAVQRAGVLRGQHVDAKAAVDYAIEHGFAKKSTVKERRLITDAIWRGIGDASVAAIDGEHKKRKFVRDGQADAAWVTTPEVLKEEQFIVRFARHARGAADALAPGADITRDWLSDEQKQAVRDLWERRDGVMVLAGKAGVGKTTVATEVVEGIRRNGQNVVMLAPTTKSVKVLEKEGFKPHTLERFLLDDKLQAAASGRVLFLDEAGQVSTIDMARFFRVAHRLNARVILSGDRFQHKAVERGKALQLVELESGVKPIAISQIRRQEDKRLRRAVEKLSRGDIYGGFQALEKLGAIRELPDELRNTQLASDYVKAIEAGYSALVIAPTNAEKDIVTQTIRETLKARGHIGKEERTFKTLKRYDWDAAERRDSQLYSAGDVVEFRTKGKGGFLPGDRVSVQEVRDGKVWVQHRGETKPLPMTAAGGFAVYRQTEKGFAENDTIRILQNRGAKPGEQRLNNGDVFTVRFRKDGQIDLGNGVSFDPATFPHFDHGIVTTSYSAQGDTKDQVFIAQSSRSFPASSPEQAYVSASRAKKNVQIYTDDLEGLRSAVSRSRPDESAIELARRVKTGNRDRIKKQIDRLRHLGQRGREFARQQVRRMAQRLQPQMEPTAKIAR